MVVQVPVKFTLAAVVLSQHFIHLLLQLESNDRNYLSMISKSRNICGSNCCHLPKDIDSKDAAATKCKCSFAPGL